MTLKIKTILQRGVSLSIIGLLALSNVGYAHELLESSGDTTKFRWANNYYHSDRKVRVVDLRYNGDYLNDDFKAQLSKSASDWNNNSDERVYMLATTYSSAKVKLASVINVPSWIFYGVVGYTNVADINGKWLIDSSGNKQTIGNSLYYGNIYMMPSSNYRSLTTTERKKTLTHEIGHVMGIGHPPEGTTSVMEAHTAHQSSIPQSHEKTDLKNMYPN